MGSVQKWLCRCVLAGLFCCLTSPAQAQMKIKLKGILESNLFMGLHPQDNIVANNNLGQFFNYRNNNSFALEVKAKLGDSILGHTRIELRNINFSQASASTDLENYNKMFPVSVRLNEAYIEFYGILNVLDLTIGQQRIAWGTTTVFNPTDNLNPFNLENPLDFQTRLPIPALKATVTMGERVTLTLVNIPMYTPPVLPVSLFKDVTSIDVSALVPNGFKLGAIQSNEIIEQPEFRVENMQAAARLAVNIDPVNFSVSYFYGRSFIPVPSKIPIVNPGLDLAKLSVTPIAKDVVLAFPRFHAIGADMSVAILGVDIRIEASLFIPVEQVTADITIQLDSNDASKGVTRKNPLTGKDLATVVYKQDPYFKMVAEIEYTFPGGWMGIFQYIYGFFNEQEWDKLHHYWMLTVRKTFFRDKLEMRVVGGFELDVTPTSGEAQDGKEPGYAFLTNLELIWKPYDAGQIVLGGIVARGIAGTTYRLFQPLAQVYIRAKMEFK